MEARERLARVLSPTSWSPKTVSHLGQQISLDRADAILKALHLTDAAALALMDGEPAERFFLSTDNDSHWYLVPVARKADWGAWRDIPEDDERAWDPPDFAKRLNGAPSLVTFENPEVDQ